MGSKTGIEWTDATWNPIIGCSRVSEGCRNCYAEGIAGRFGNGKETVYSGLTQIVNGRAVWTGKIAETRQLLQPLSWKPVVSDQGSGVRGQGVSRPRRIFVNSMSDLFHENVRDELRDRIFAVMALCPQHTFQVLTKRPERMLRYLERDRSDYWFSAALDMAKSPMGFSDDCVSPLPNVWLGVSVENQATADERIPLLLNAPAAVRFISAEPLLGEIELCEFDQPELNVNWLRGENGTDPPIPKLDWVICGGESGPHARPMHPDWARGLRDQCVAAGVPFFFKQWGEWAPSHFGEGLPDPHEGMPSHYFDDRPYKVWRFGKKVAGAMLDGREWKEFPAVCA